MRIIRLSITLLLFLSLLSCQKKENNIENKFIKIEKLSEYHDITDAGNKDILYLVKFSDFGNEEIQGGLQSILSIDNIQDNLLEQNADLIKNSTAEDILQGRLRSIEEECKQANSNWTDFKIVDSVKTTNFKGYKAAVAEFEVTEHVDYLNEKIQKRIKRYVIFVKNDLWNIVIAPTKIEDYDIEMKDFNKMINSLEIK